MDKAEVLAEDFISGRLSCDECPDLTTLVEAVRNSEMPKKEFVEIIERHLQKLQELT